MGVKGLNRGWSARLRKVAEMFPGKQATGISSPGRWIYPIKMPDVRSQGKGETMGPERELGENLPKNFPFPCH